MSKNKTWAETIAGNTEGQINVSPRQPLASSIDDSIEAITNELKKAQELDVNRAKISDVRAKVQQIKSMLQSQIDKAGSKDKSRLIQAMESCGDCDDVTGHSEADHIKILKNLGEAHSHLSHHIEREHHQTHPAHHVWHPSHHHQQPH